MIASTEKLYRAVLHKQALSTEFSAIDHSKPFMPEALTQLYHTDCYALLSHQQRLRYNQLFSLRSIEQLMTLEARFIGLIISRSQRTRLLQSDQQLHYCMHEMISEEAEHYQMFHSLNQLAEPAIYEKQEMFFARMSILEKGTLELLARLPGIIPFLLWILLILEEFSTYVSKQMMQEHGGALGELEENFVKAHREHLKDESRHVAICANALIQVLEHSTAKNRRLNSAMLHFFMKEYMTPKRGGLRVIRKLTEEFPELESESSAMLQAIRQHSPDPVIWGAITDSRTMPTTNELMRRFPEFIPMNSVS